MTTKLEQAYFDWLVAQIEVRSTRTFHDLFERLHNTEFVWVVPEDDNRVQDGLDLRTEFLNELGRNPQRELRTFFSSMQKGASVLEVMVALSRRIAFTAGGRPRDWAWQLIENLRLQKMSDPFTDQKSRKVEEVLESLIWRTYDKDGLGGFFPLNDTLEDQTKVEIWYQMQKYVMEIDGP